VKPFVKQEFSGCDRHGFYLFDEIRTSKPSIDSPVQKDSIFYCKGKGLEAIGEYSIEGFVMYKGSQMSKTTSNSIHNHLITNRETLINDGVVEENEEAFIFTKDYLFNSPSQAASIVLGRSANGWTEWNDIEGNTLNKVKRGEG
jgi:hypothetical protein